MNWLLMFKDEVYIYGKLIDFMCYKDYVEVKIGLMNKDFDKICSLISNMEVFGSILSKVDEDLEYYVEIFFNEFYFKVCILLCCDWNVIFFLKLNGIR